MSFDYPHSIYAYRFGIMDTLLANSICSSITTTIIRSVVPPHVGDTTINLERTKNNLFGRRDFPQTLCGKCPASWQL